MWLVFFKWKCVLFPGEIPRPEQAATQTDIFKVALDHKVRILEGIKEEEEGGGGSLYIVV